MLKRFRDALLALGLSAFAAQFALAQTAPAAAPAAPAAYPSAAQTKIQLEGKYVGSDACRKCHKESHAKWATSYHTLKATQGPAFGKDFEKNVHAWVKRDWDKLETFMIVDRKDATTNYVATQRTPYDQVAYVIGQVRKQRYTTYYDGGPLETWESRTEDGGISWKIDKTKTFPFPGNKDRAGYKFLHLETKKKDGEINKNQYGEFYSWQERCIACHTTGFDANAWAAAKADFKAGKRADLKDIFVADLRVGCEACHGPGSVHENDPAVGNILQPAKVTDVAIRQLVCVQCHTRTGRNINHAGANDLRGFRPTQKYTSFATYTSPAWGKGNRAVSMDGKGRRDHQMDFDIALSATIKGPLSVHADMACFDCHDAHNTGNKPKHMVGGKKAVEVCATCHKGKAGEMIKVMDGSKGWERAKFGAWATEAGRGAPRQHVFNFDDKGRAFGLRPDQYHWVLKANGDAAKEGDWASIWPMEKAAYDAKGQRTAIGATPWKN